MRLALCLLNTCSGGGYTQKELEAFRPIIYNNLVSQMKVLIGASGPLNCPISEANQVCELFRVGKLRHHLIAGHKSDFQRFRPNLPLFSAFLYWLLTSTGDRFVFIVYLMCLCYFTNNLTWYCE